MRDQFTLIKDIAELILTLLGILKAVPDFFDHDTKSDSKESENSD